MEKFIASYDVQQFVPLHGGASAKSFNSLPEKISVAL